MSYIENETITPDGVTQEFNLVNNFQPGTLMVLFNDKLFYEYHERSTTPVRTIRFNQAPPVGADIKISYLTWGERWFGNAQRYLTPYQWKDLTRSNINFPDATLDKIIREAEYYIDQIVGAHQKYYDVYGSQENRNAQELVFPRLVDGERALEIDTDAPYAPIPKDLVRACMYACDHLNVVGTPNQDNLLDMELESERMGDYSYKRRAFGGFNSRDMAIKAIGNKAFSMLRGYIRNHGRLTIDPQKGDEFDQPKSDALLNSRQRFSKNNY